MLEEDAEALCKEQDILDKIDDQVAKMSVRLKKLCSSATPTNTNNVLLTRKLEYLHGCVTTKIQILHFGPEDSSEDEEIQELEVSIVEQLQIQLLDYESALKTIHEELLSIEDQDSVKTEKELHSKLDDMLFECLSAIRKLLKTHCDAAITNTSAAASADRLGVKLPKIDVPTFNGDILQWRQFWEQYCISVHERTSLTDSEKVVYLRHALKDRSAKGNHGSLNQENNTQKPSSA